MRKLLTQKTQVKSTIALFGLDRHLPFFSRAIAEIVTPLDPRELHDPPHSLFSSIDPENSLIVLWVHVEKRGRDRITGPDSRNERFLQLARKYMGAYSFFLLTFIIPSCPGSYDRVWTVLDNCSYDETTMRVFHVNQDMMTTETVVWNNVKADLFGQAGGKKTGSPGDFGSFFLSLPPPPSSS